MTPPLRLHFLINHDCNSPPQVGSFEEVVMRMTASAGNELAAWSQVMFVAPELLRDSAGAGGKK